MANDTAIRLLAFSAGAVVNDRCSPKSKTGSGLQCADRHPLRFFFCCC
jgi:hypothetical protein